MLSKDASFTHSLTQLIKVLQAVASTKMHMELDCLFNRALSIVQHNHLQRQWDFMVSALDASTLYVLIRRLPPKCFHRLRLLLELIILLLQSMVQELLL